jgi:uncharacterized protein (DUF934 family)
MRMVDEGSSFMDDEVRAFGMELGKRALAREWSSVREMLAPWLRPRYTVDEVRTFFEDEYRATLSANGIDGLRYPEYAEPELGGNGFTKATQLREPISFAGGKVRAVAPEVTDDNVRWWLRLQLTCSDEQMEAFGFDYFCEVWMAVVDTEEGLKVGYWSQGSY